VISPHQDPTFILVAITTAKMCHVLVEKMAKKCHFFTFFEVIRQNFLGSRQNISTNEPVLERLLNLNFWDIFQADSTSGSGFGASQSQKIKK
jgi:hypothetical protein